MRRFTVLLILSAVFLPACASTKFVRTPVAKQYDFIVTLEQTQEEGTGVQQKHEQPYKIELAVLKKFMGDLRYIEKAGMLGKNEPGPVFLQDEIDRLAPVLANTLAMADASQQIRFLSFNQDQSLIFSVSRKTEGVLFVESGGRLNMAFNFINSKRLPSESSAMYSNYSEVDPTHIKSSDTTISSTAPYAELRDLETGKQAPMWVVADLGKLRESISTGAVSIIKAPENTSPEAAPKTGTMSTSVEKTAPASASEDMLKQDIKNKLKYLKELLDEGLISEKDFNTKKMELLNKIN